jgi:hypothetical protein
LLDFVSPAKAEKVISAASRLQDRYAGVPILDLKGKHKEFDCLLDEIRRESKRAIVKDRSNKEEILEEAIDSLITWLNDIWGFVYEYNVNFELAHKCLLYCHGLLSEIGQAGVG